jgi:hypothetical protein
LLHPLGMQSNMLRGIRSILAQSSGVHDGKRDSCFRLKRRKFSYGNLFSRKRPANADSRCDLLQNLGMLSLPLHGLALRESLASPTCFNNPTVKLNEAASNRRYLSMPIDDSSMIIPPFTDTCSLCMLSLSIHIEHTCHLSCISNSMDTFDCA